MSRLVIPALLIIAVLMSAIGLVYSKHMSRKLFVELQHLKQQMTNLDTHWGRLQLEQSAWTDHGRIERIARERLLMKQPQADDVVFIEAARTNSHEILRDLKRADLRHVSP